MPLQAVWLVLVGLGASAACVEQELQTASLEATGGLGGAPADPFDCATSVVGQLPAGEVFGEGQEPVDWLFATGEYGVSEGPGISIVARDSFRLWVDGQLLVEGEAARAPVHLPLSLTPGDHVIAVSVVAEQGTPAARLHLDELERTTVSDASWRVSSAPEADWTAVGFDDSAWAAARELAPGGAWPGCDPTENFPVSSAARWIGAEEIEGGPIALRGTVHIGPVGFAETTTGGAGAEPVLVSTWAELESLAVSTSPAIIVVPEGVHDFRPTGSEVVQQEVCPTECSNEPGKTRYEVLLSGETCANTVVSLPRSDRILRFGSNKTLVGLGRGAALRGVSIDFQASENIVVRNVAVYDVNPGMVEAGDALSFNEPRRVWVDHATVRWISDGFADFRAGSSAITLSWVRFDGGNEQECGGIHSEVNNIGDSEVTIHHSLYDRIAMKGPRAVGEGSRVHLFDNVYTNVTSWAIDSNCRATVLVEGSTFQSVEVIARSSTCSDDTGAGYLDFPAGSNLYRDGNPVFGTTDGQEPHATGFSPPYEYTVELANDVWPVVLSRAGAGGPWALPLALD
ncbi:MAG TPA: hypothetical protein VLC09_17385 [Polyangiaceae bacterium]|nr:hypothetical protein [Polyangiaceae bacterium]